MKLERIYTKIYLVGLALFLLGFLLEMTYPWCMDETGKLTKISLCVKLAGLALAAVKIVMTWFDGGIKNGFKAFVTNKLVWAAAALFVLLAFSCWRAGTRVMLLYPILMMGAIGIDGKKVIGTVVAVQAAALFVVILLSQVGSITDYVFLGDRVRHGLGFDWCTDAPVLFFYISLGYVYIRGEKLKWFECLILEAGHVALFLVTQTRMTFVLASVAMAFFLVQSLWKKPWRIWDKIHGALYAVPALCAAFSIGTAVAYRADSTFWTKLDTLMSGRLVLGQNAIRDFGISLLAKPVEWVGFTVKDMSGVGYNYVDSSYLQILLNYGIIVFAAVLAIYVYALFKGMYGKDYRLVFALLFAMLHAVTEPRLFNYAFNALSILAFCQIGTPIVRKPGETSGENPIK